MQEPVMEQDIFLKRCGDNRWRELMWCCSRSVPATMTKTFIILAAKIHTTVHFFTMDWLRWEVHWHIWIRRKREEPCVRYMAPMAGARDLS